MYTAAVSPFILTMPAVVLSSEKRAPPISMPPPMLEPTAIP